MAESDIRLGALALRKGLVSAEQLASGLHAAWVDADRPNTLWQNLVSDGVADLDQIHALQRALATGAPTEPAQFLPPPERRYTLERRLGEGGMGVVRQVKDRALGRSVAMKQLASEQALDDEQVGTLLAEARVAGMLEHPNIIPIYDVGRDVSGDPYYTMRLMDQMSVEDVLLMLRQGNPEAAREFPTVRLLRILQQVCLAVDYAHSRGVIHRDLKPDNIRLGRYGEVQVADWGLARVDGLPDLPLRRALGQAYARGEVTPCIVIGSPNYMSPEQACGLNDEVGPAHDIYALGAILYEILTLTVPHEDVDTQILLDKVEKDAVVPPSQAAPGRRIPSELEDLCMAMLQKDPADRIQDVRVVWRRLEDYLEGYRARAEVDDQVFELIQRGHGFGEAWRRLREARDRLATRMKAQPDPKRRRRLERDLRALELEVETVWGEAYDAYTRAVGLKPGDLVGRAKLAELAWGHLVDAENRCDAVQCQFYWNMLARYNDGAWDGFLVGTATLTVQTEPPGAVVALRSYSQMGVSSRDASSRAVGRSPVSASALPAGLYLVSVALEGHRPQARPVFVRANQEREVVFDRLARDPG